MPIHEDDTMFYSLLRNPNRKGQVAPIVEDLERDLLAKNAAGIVEPGHGFAGAQTQLLAEHTELATHRPDDSDACRRRAS